MLDVFARVGCHLVTVFDFSVPLDHRLECVWINLARAALDEDVLAKRALAGLLHAALAQKLCVIFSILAQSFVEVQSWNAVSGAVIVVGVETVDLELRELVAAAHFVTNFERISGKKINLGEFRRRLEMK